MDFSSSLSRTRGQIPPPRQSGVQREVSPARFLDRPTLGELFGHEIPLSAGHCCLINVSSWEVSLEHKVAEVPRFSHGVGGRSAGLHGRVRTPARVCPAAGLLRASPGSCRPCAASPGAAGTAPARTATWGTTQPGPGAHGAALQRSGRARFSESRRPGSPHRVAVGDGRLHLAAGRRHVRRHTTAGARRTDHPFFAARSRPDVADHSPLRRRPEENGRIRGAPQRAKHAAGFMLPGESRSTCRSMRNMAAPIPTRWR